MEKESTVKLIMKLQEDFFSKVPIELCRKYTNSYGATHALKFLKTSHKETGKFKDLSIHTYRKILFDFHEMILEEMVTKGYVFNTCIGSFYCQKVRAFSKNYYPDRHNLNYEHSNYRAFLIRWKRKIKTSRNLHFYSFRLTPLARKRIAKYAHAQKVVSVVLKDTYYGSMGIFQRSPSKNLQRPEHTDTSQG